MDRVSQEELISAYFDGMVTGEERQQAENLLQESAAARAWLAQLKALHSSLGDLPKQKVPADCTAAVLRKAEQEMLLAGAGPLAHEPVVAPYVAKGLPAETHVRIWIALCVAAAALIIVVLPQYFQQRESMGPVALRKLPEPSRTFSDQVADAPTDRYEKGQSDDSELAELAKANKAPGADAADFDKKEKAAGTSTLGLPMMKGGAGGGLAAGEDSAVAATNAPNAEAPIESFSYVYDVPTPAAQQAVLKKFEQTLRDNQIVLENAAADESAPTAGAASVPQPLLAGRTVVQAEQKKLPEPEPQDRVYVIEAQPWQLANTITSLDDLAGQSEPVRRTRQLQDREQRTVQLQTRLESVREKEAASQDAGVKQNIAGPRPSPTSGLNYGVNPRSQAVRLRTEFEEQTANERGNASFYSQRQAAPGESKPGTTTTAGQTPPARLPAPSAPAAQSATRSVQDNRVALPQQQRAGGVDQLDRRQRAVIIFRVVPERAEEVEGRTQPSASQKQP